MYYSRIEETGNGLILRRDRTMKFFYWLILIFAIMCLLPGLLLILDPDMGITANFPLGFGLVFFAGAMLLNDMRKKFPEVVEFLNNQQMVKISGHQKEHIFSYFQIDRFFRRTSSDGSIISLMKKDGSIWDLMSVNYAKNGEKKLALLRENIKLKPEAVLPEIQYQLPPSFKKSGTTSGTYFYWKEGQVKKQLSLVFFMLAGFGTMLGYSLKGSEHYNTFLWSYVFVLGLIAIYFVYMSVIAQTKYSMVVFDMSEVSYGQGNIDDTNTLPDFKARKKMTVSELESIRYSFDGYHSLFYSIMFLDKETEEGINKLESENSYAALMDFRKVLKTYSHLFKFNISGKDVIDIANFASALQQAVREKYRK